MTAPALRWSKLQAIETANERSNGDDCIYCEPNYDTVGVIGEMQVTVTHPATGDECTVTVYTCSNKTDGCSRYLSPTEALYIASLKLGE